MFKKSLYSIIFNLIAGLLLMQFFPCWQKLAEFVISSNVLSHAAAPLSLVALRLQIPNYPRAFKLPMSTFLSFLAFFIFRI